MGQNQFKIFFKSVSAFTFHVSCVLVFVSSANGQILQMRGLSPLNDKNYFKMLKKKYAKKSQLKRPTKMSTNKIKIDLKKIELLQAKKIIAPKPIAIESSYVKTLNGTIPGNLGPSQNEGEVLKRFGDQAIQNWLNSPAVRNSSFGKAATQVENAMKVEATVQTAPHSPGATPIDHKFSFQYLALQSQAKMEYKGYTNAQIKIDSSKNETAVEVSEKVFKNKDFVISHTKNATDNNSTMGLRWSW
ncbi:MAG: hypothetical protein J0M15_10330 [Deltaproteobacteria bacterium]|nr:hypothetical protein [Deltaproteobacteria bacterium]